MTLEALGKFGANVEDGLKRCMNNEAFYLRLVGMALDDGAFESLGATLSENDLDKAFEEAHKLKGATGNLSLTPIYDPLVTLTELLRNKTPGDYDALYKTVMEKTNELRALMK